ncbi:unnamed protein product, partial [Staurois parvus]
MSCQSAPGRDAGVSLILNELEGCTVVANNNQTHMNVLCCSHM